MLMSIVTIAVLWLVRYHGQYDGSASHICGRIGTVKDGSLTRGRRVPCRGHCSDHGYRAGSSHGSDGNSLHNVPVGDQTLNVSYVGYAKTSVSMPLPII